MSVISRSCNARVELVEPAQIHWLLQQRHNIRVESLPVGVLSQLSVVNWEHGSLNQKFSLQTHELCLVACSSAADLQPFFYIPQDDTSDSMKCVNISINQAAHEEID